MLDLSEMSNCAAALLKEDQEQLCVPQVEWHC